MSDGHTLWPRIRASGHRTALRLLPVLRIRYLWSVQRWGLPDVAALSATMQAVARTLVKYSLPFAMVTIDGHDSGLWTCGLSRTRCPA